MGKISPSMMCVDLMNVEYNIRLLEEAEIDYLHIDIMDNHFVPNITLSGDFIHAVKAITEIPLDIHLMIEEPENSLHMFQGCGKEDIICIHYESTKHIQRALAMMREMGVKTGISLNPGTPLCMIEDILVDLDMVLIMTVNPGFAGQKLVPATLDKIEKLKEMLKQKEYSHIWVEVDGNVSFAHAEQMCKKGADIYVGGSSSVFSKEGTIKQNVARLRAIIDNKEGVR